MNKERLEEIVEKIAEQLYDRIVVPETKVIIEYQDIKCLFNTIEEQSEQLYGTKHKYGYKDMYGKCNADYASLNSEKEELSRQNKRYREFIENVSDNWLIAEKIKNEVEGIRIITPHHLLNWINKEANKLLEE